MIRRNTVSLNDYMKPSGRKESSGNKAPAHQHLQGQPSHATSVVENVFRTLDFTVTGGDVSSGAQKLLKFDIIIGGEKIS